MDDKKNEDEFDDLDFDDLDNDFNDDDFDADDDLLIEEGAQDDITQDDGVSFEDEDFPDMEDDWEEAEPAEDNTSKSSKKSSSKILLPVLLLLALGGGGAYYYTQILTPGAGVASQPSSQDSANLSPYDSPDTMAAEMQAVPDTPQPETDIAVPMPSPISGPEDEFDDMDALNFENRQPPPEELTESPDIVAGYEPDIPQINAPENDGVLLPMPDAQGEMQNNAESADEFQEESFSPDFAFEGESEEAGQITSADAQTPFEEGPDEGMGFDNDMSATELDATENLEVYAPGDNASEQELQELRTQNQDLETRLQSLEQETASKEQRLAEMAEKLQALENQLSQKEQELKSTRSQAEELRSQVRENAQTAKAPPAAPSPQKDTAAASVPKPPKSPSKPATEIMPAWELRSAQPGRAYIGIKNSQSTLVVTPGDTIQGLGVVQSIAMDEQGLWVVKGSNGSITQ